MTQYDHVLKVMERSTRALAIHQISAKIWTRFKVRHADTAISARIREIRKDLEKKGRTIISHRAAKDKAHHLYAIAPLT